MALFGGYGTSRGHNLARESTPLGVDLRVYSLVPVPVLSPMNENMLGQLLVLPPYFNLWPRPWKSHDRTSKQFHSKRFLLLSPLLFESGKDKRHRHHIPQLVILKMVLPPPEQ